jgi:alpha-L-fucosidase 2
LGRQVSDYRSLYSRVHLDLDGGNNDLPTDQLISGYHRAVGPRKRLLEELYFQYGRYLLISSSRGIDLPNNLQGIWNDSDSPAWQCDMHADINVQMNYWPAEKANLPEMHEKFLNYLYNMSQVQPQWRSYARDRAGQTTGWVNFTENNIFGHCTTWHNDYVEAGAWECAHLWQHYRYTQDRNFLRYRAMPVMLSCVRFWMQRLVRDPHDSLWVCPDEWSPEHGPIKSITAHAQQIVWNLFSNTIDAVRVLGIKGSGISAAEFRQLKEKFTHLDNGLHTEIYQGTFGADRFGVHTGDTILREWKYTDYAIGNHGESNHRHLSHLMALYPLDNLAPSSPYFRPAVNSLRLRGLQSQGWSMGWKMNLWARAQEGDSCQKIFNLAFRHSSDDVINMSSTAGGVYYNLLDSHSPFQIDGNFGVCAGMAEMLLQNQKDTILLLPALSSSWRTGRVDGLKAEGDFTIGMDWRNGVLEKATVGSGSGIGCWLEYPDIARAVVTDERGRRLRCQAKGPDRIFLSTKTGEKYRIEMSSSWKRCMGHE